MFEVCNWRCAALSIAVPNLVGFASAAIGGSPDSHPDVRAWYQNLNKSPLTPPNWAFPIVWPALYTSMGYASYLVCKDGDGFNGAARIPLTVYGAQLLANFLFTPVFFRRQCLAGSMVVCGLNAILAGACVRLFKPINEHAAMLMVPVTIWTTFATYLTIYMFKNNTNTCGQKTEKTN